MTTRTSGIITHSTYTTSVNTEASISGTYGSAPLLPWNQLRVMIDRPYSGLHPLESLPIHPAITQYRRVYVEFGLPCVTSSTGDHFS
jgi:hypothetical protein